MARRSFFKSRRGGAAVELAVLFPVILLMLIGIVDYGRILYTWVTVSNAARAGAEYGQQRVDMWPDSASQNAAAQVDGNQAGTLTLDSRMVCECAGAPQACTAGSCLGGAAPEVYIRTSATKTVNMFLSYPGLPSTVTISKVAYMRAQ